MADIPVLITGSYAGGVVQAGWEYSGTAVSFILAVFKGQPQGTSWIANTAVTGFFGQLTIQASALDPSFAYTVAVAVDQGNGQPGPWSAPMSLVFQQVTAISAAYSSKDLTVAWTISYPSSIAAVAVALTDQTTGVTIKKTSSGIYGDNEVTFALKSPLTVGDTYKLTLTGVNGTFFGPTANGPAPIVAAPALASLSYTIAADGKATIAAMGQIVSPAPAPSVVMQLFQDGTPTLQQPGQGFVAQLTLPAPLSPWSKYAVGLFYQDGPSTGPVGNRGSVLQTAPVIASTAFDGTNVTVTWAILPDEPAPAGAQATLYDVSGVKPTKVGSGFANGLSATFQPNSTLSPTGNYAVTLAPLLGQSQGPEGPRTPVIAATKAIATLVYDGARIAVTFPDQLGSNVTGYLLHLMSGAQSVRHVQAGTTGGVIDVALDPGWQYQVAVQAMGGIAAGPIGTPVALIAQPPTLTSAAVTGTTLSLGWVPPAMPANVTITGYLVRFRVGSGLPVTTTIAGAVTSGTINLGTIAGLTDDPLRPASVTLAAQASAVTGPESAPLAVLRHAPTLPSAAVAGGNVEAQWAPAPGPVDSYQTVVTKDSSAVATAYVPGTKATIPVASPVTGSTYALSVTPTIGAAYGPASTALNLVLIGPAVSGAVFDGKTVTASVTAPNVGSATLTGYRMVLTVNGRIAQTSDVAAGSTIAMPVDDPVDPGAAYAVAAMALAGSATGPLGGATTMIQNAPAITAVTCTGTSLVMTLDPSSVAGASLVGFLYTDGAPGSAVAASNNQVTFTVAAGHSYQVASQAISGTTKGPQSRPLGALTVAPTLAASAYRDGRLALAWSGTDSAGTYLVTVANGATTVVQSRVTGLSAELAFNADPAIDYTVSIQQTQSIVTGPAMTATAVATSGCAITALTFSDASTASVTWSAPPSHAANVTKYQVVALTEGTEQVLTSVNAPATTTPVSISNLATGVSYALAVRPVIANATGPLGTPIPLITAVPAGLAAGYDGRNIVAQWEPVVDARVARYQATISITGKADIPVDTASASLRYAYDISTLAGTDAISVKVAARAGVSIGPNTAIANVRTGNPAFYVGDLAGAVAPAVYPCLTVPPGAADLVFYLPELFGTHQTQAITQGPFTLQPMSPVTAPYAYTVTINSSSSLWSFASLSSRQTIAAQFASFLAAIAGTAGARPQAARIVQQTLGAGLPLTFGESLLYRYSFDPQMRFVDLQAGMRLEIRYESYQYVTGGSDGIDGYVTGGVATYEISNLPEGAGASFTAVDPFLGSMQAISFAAAQQGGAGGVIDLQTAAYRRPFLRLFYPASFPAGQGTGSANANQAAAIVAAASWSALDSVTRNFIQFGTLPAPSATAAINYFRGRAVLVPLIAVGVNGTSAFVPLGTTLGAILAAHGLMPDLTGVVVSGLSLRRPISPNLPPADVATGLALASKRPVMVAYQKFAPFSDGTTMLDLPLVQGDEVLTGRLAEAAR